MTLWSTLRNHIDVFPVIRVVALLSAISVYLVLEVLLLLLLLITSLTLLLSPKIKLVKELLLIYFFRDNISLDGRCRLLRFTT